MNRYLATIILLIIFFVRLSGKPGNESNARQREKTSIVTGRWEITEKSGSPLSILPLCKAMQKGSIFNFTGDSLEVYTNSTSYRCDVYLFKISHSTISFIKEDMVWLCNFELKQNYLKISSGSFFTVDEPDTSLLLKEKNTGTEVTISLKKQNIKTK